MPVTDWFYSVLRATFYLQTNNSFTLSLTQSKDIGFQVCADNMWWET